MESHREHAGGSGSVFRRSNDTPFFLARMAQASVPVGTASSPCQPRLRRYEGLKCRIVAGCPILRELLDAKSRDTVRFQFWGYRITRPDAAATFWRADVSNRRGPSVAISIDSDHRVVQRLELPVAKPTGAREPDHLARFDGMALGHHTPGRLNRF